MDVDAEKIQKEVWSRKHSIEPYEEWFTPAGNLRSAPVYQVQIRNRYLGKERLVKDKDLDSAQRKAFEQLTKWNEQEIKTRIAEAKRDAKEAARADAEAKDATAKEQIEALQGILAATLDFDDRIDWDELLDKREFRAFSYPTQRPTQPEALRPASLPAKPFWSWLIPALKRRWEAKCGQAVLDRERQEHESQVAWENAARQWDASYLAAHQNHERQKAAFLDTQRKRNESVLDFRSRFEAGEPKAVEEYCAAVFERSSYPDCFFVEHSVAYDQASTTVVVDLRLPAPEDVSNIEGYKFIASRKEAKPQYLKKKVFEELYDQALKQCVIRTIHEVFEAVYTHHVEAVVVNGWVTSVDKATGNDVTSCVISVSAERSIFESFDLSRVDVSECIKALKGLLAGPLSGVAPVKPIMVLNRQDGRFVESKEVLAELNSEANLAEMPWEDFEHLVRELFAGLFSGEDTQVNVTQASRDKGVDAIAFDPDPIRGGKFVIQAKRYTNVVPVSAVRDLYGTMIAEGAAKGILVTTSHYGRDARQFAKDKPIMLMDGPHLVHLLEQQGHKVRLDVAAARAKRT